MKDLILLKKLLQGLEVSVDVKLKITKKMARQKGVIKLKGKIGDLSFYKTQDGHLAREKGGVDAEASLKTPLSFAPVRTALNLVLLQAQGKP